jgi:ATP-dependent phosphofructokinase / diphosphate-dependent phosphofructokinase
VAGKTRVMEDELINAAGNDVTPAFYDYLRPLLGRDTIEVARLRSARVEKAGVLTGDGA